MVESMNWGSSIVYNTPSEGAREPGIVFTQSFLSSLEKLTRNILMILTSFVMGISIFF